MELGQRTKKLIEAVLSGGPETIEDFFAYLEIVLVNPSEFGLGEEEETK